MGGSCGTYAGEKWCYRVLVGKPEGKEPLGRPRLSCEDNIKMSQRKRMGNYELDSSGSV
jgi:hypothetical protein